MFWPSRSDVLRGDPTIFFGDRTVLQSDGLLFWHPVGHLKLPPWIDLWGDSSLIGGAKMRLCDRPWEVFRFFEPSFFRMVSFNYFLAQISTSRRCVFSGVVRRVRRGRQFRFGRPGGTFPRSWQKKTPDFSHWSKRMGTFRVREWFPNYDKIWMKQPILEWTWPRGKRIIKHTRLEKRRLGSN